MARPSTVVGGKKVNLYFSEEARNKVKAIVAKLKKGTKTIEADPTASASGLLTQMILDKAKELRITKRDIEKALADS